VLPADEGEIIFLKGRPIIVTEAVGEGRQTFFEIVTDFDPMKVRFAGMDLAAKRHLLQRADAERAIAPGLDVIEYHRFRHFHPHDAS
jgi:hypothetical protein